MNHLLPLTRENGEEGQLLQDTLMEAYQSVVGLPWHFYQAGEKRRGT